MCCMAMQFILIHFIIYNLTKFLIKLLRIMYHKSDYKYSVLRIILYKINNQNLDMINDFDKR